MRGITRPEPNELDVSSYYEKDPSKILRVKVAMLDAHDRLVEEYENDVERRGDKRKYHPRPSLARIMAAMPFWVNERLACEIRRQLIRDGEIPEVMNSSPKNKVQNVTRKERQFPFQVPFKSLKDQVENNKQVIVILNRINSRDKAKTAEILDKMSPKEACDWARKRYAAAWSSISRIRTDGLRGRPGTEEWLRLIKAGPRRDEVFGG